MTYRLDSDITWSYGEVRALGTDQFMAPTTKPNWKDAVEDFSGWLLSHGHFLMTILYKASYLFR
jgi:hypothetical protein